MRTSIAFDDDTFDMLIQPGRDRTAAIQELAEQAFAGVLKKHGVPIDLKDALRKRARLSGAPPEQKNPPQQKKAKARRATS